MAVPLDNPPQAQRALAALEREKKQDADERITAWTVVWTLFIFKMATVVTIWFAASGAPEANALLAATTWYWIIIPIVAVSGAVAFRWRLIRMRRQRQRLRHAEWMEQGDTDTETTTITDDDVRLLIQPHNDDRRSA